MLNTFQKYYFANGMDSTPMASLPEPFTDPFMATLSPAKPFIQLVNKPLKCH